MKTPYVFSLASCALPFFAAASIASAATLTWDSSGANPTAPTNGGGTWSTSIANWTDGTTESSWPSGTSGSNYNAVFGGGSGSGGTITLGGVIVCGTATFNSSGYILTGGTLSLPVSGGVSILVAANVTTEIDSYILSSGNNTVSVLAGGTLTLRGGQNLGSQGNYQTTTTSTIVLASGTYSGSVVNAKGNVVVGEVSSNAIAQYNASTLQIGYGISGTTTYVSANASSTVTNTFNIGRDGKGVMDLKAGVVTVTAASPNNVTVGVNSGANNSALLVEGGTLSINNTATRLVINGGVTSANGAASVIVSGGVLNTPGIQFGAGSTAFAASTSGTFKVSGGTVYLGVSGSTVNAIAVNATAAPVSNAILLSGGTLAATGDWTSSMAMSLSSADGGVTFHAANASGVSRNITLSGTLSGGGSLTKTGSGTLFLGAANTYTGQTAVNAGILEIDANNALGTNAAGTVVASGASLKLNGINYSTAEALTLNGSGALINSGVSTYAGQITSATNATINVGGGTLTLTGGLVKNGTVLTLTGGGTVNVNSVGITGASANSDLVVDNVTANLNTANSYNGPTYIRNAGIVNANAINALPTDNGRSAIVMDDTGTGSSALNLGENQSIGSLSGAATSAVNLGAYTLTVGGSTGTSTFAGAIAGSGGSLIKDGQNTQILSGTNTYSGSTQVAAGTLIVNGSLASSGTVSIGATLGGSGSIAGAVTSSGSVAGTLQFGSSVMLKDHASLTGASHAISGTLIAGSGATVAPGDSAGGIGTLTVGSFSLQTGAILSMDINGTLAGTNSDLITTTASNGLSLGGSLTLTIGSSYVTTSADTLVLILNNGTGETSTFFSGLTVTSATGSSTYSGEEGTLVVIGGQTFKLTYYGGSGSNDVELLAVPEPGTWAMMAGGMGLLIGFQRMRRKSK